MISSVFFQCECAVTCSLTTQDFIPVQNSKNGKEIISTLILRPLHTSTPYESQPLISAPHTETQHETRWHQPK
jgi:hypothetical protein